MTRPMAWSPCLPRSAIWCASAASFARLSRGGFGDNLNIRGLENYNKDVYGGRGTLELGGYGAPVLIRISGDYTRDKSDPRNGHRLIPGIRSNTPVLRDVYDTRAGLNAPKQDIEAYGVAMNISAELTDTVTLPFDQRMAQGHQLHPDRFRCAACHRCRCACRLSQRAGQPGIPAAV